MSIAFYIFPAEGLKEREINISISFTYSFLYRNRFEEENIYVKDKSSRCESLDTLQIFTELEKWEKKIQVQQLQSYTNDWMEKEN